MRERGERGGGGGRVGWDGGGEACIHVHYASCSELCIH